MKNLASSMYSFLICSSSKKLHFQLSFVMSNEGPVDDDDGEQETFQMSDTSRLVRSSSAGRVSRSEVNL